MRNEPTLLMFLALASLSAACAAAETASSMGIDVGTLSEVQSQTVLFKAQAERAKAQNSIEGASTPPPTAIAQPYLPQPQRTAAPVPTPAPSEGLPVVSMISGSRRAPHATLLYSSGYEVEAQSVGSQLPGGFKLASISLDGVVLIREGKLFPLGFSNRAPQP